MTNEEMKKKIIKILRDNKAFLLESEQEEVTDLIIFLIQEETCNELQRRATEWDKKAFPDGNGTPFKAMQYLLGIGEEVGELFHAHLKGTQNIRHTPEEIMLKKKDSIGDLLNFLACYCSNQNLELSECWEYALNIIKDRKVEHIKETCKWTLNKETEEYESDCGNKILVLYYCCFDNFKHCNSCGKPIEMEVEG